MPNVILGISNDGFRAGFIQALHERAATARARAQTTEHGGVSARKHSDSIEALARFVGSLPGDDPRFIAIEEAHVCVGRDRRHWAPGEKATRLIFNIGTLLHDNSHSAEHAFNELVACAVTDCAAEMHVREGDLRRQREAAHAERDSLLGMTDQITALQRDNEQLTADRDELERQVRDSRKQIEMLEAMTVPKVPSKSRVKIAEAA